MTTVLNVTPKDAGNQNRPLTVCGRIPSVNRATAVSSSTKLNSQELVQGFTYSYRVLVTNEAGSSSCNAVYRLIMGLSKSVRIFTVAANTALNLNLSLKIPKRTEPTFDDLSVVDHYRVQVSTKAGGFPALRDYRRNANEYEFSWNLAPQTPRFLLLM